MEFILENVVFILSKRLIWCLFVLIKYISQKSKYLGRKKKQIEDTILLKVYSHFN